MRDHGEDAGRLPQQRTHEIGGPQRRGQVTPVILNKIEIERFRNFIAPQTMSVEGHVTCLIGKNESGKTTVLKALHRLNSANSRDTFDDTTEYPRRRLARDRRSEDLAVVEPIKAWFSLESGDLTAVADVLGFEPPPDTQVLAARNYAGDLLLGVVGSIPAVLAAACSDVGVDDADRDTLPTDNLDTVSAAAKELAKELAEAGEQARSKAVGKLPNALKPYGLIVDGELTEEQCDGLERLLPKFFYFSNYELLPGECDLTELASRAAAGEVRRGDETLLALLALAGQKPESLLDEDYTSRQAELQAAGSDLSDQVFKYWKQNDALTVDLDTDMPIVGKAPDGSTDIRHRFLKIELNDARHGVSTNFESRSAGFRWFFSFLAAFSVHRDSPKRVVVLLDEPAMQLHGEAQKDFLSYIVEELGATQQVLYTTHSQHMLDPARYETMRAIHDRATREDPELGVVITPVNLSADRHTILPVEAALGYSVSQHLFLGTGPHLAVEGSSDFIYLLRLSEHLRSLGRTGLDPRLAIIPVGGVGNMPAFIALMGRRLDARALIDGAETVATAKKVAAAADAAGIDQTKIVVLGRLGHGLPATADIEDLFTPKDFLWLYDRAVAKLTVDDLPATAEPILRRIKIATGEPEFDHAKPAHQLTADRHDFFAQADAQTLERFEALFALLTV